MRWMTRRMPRLNRLFFRILLYFLSLLLPIIIIGAVFYINVSNRLQDEFTQKVQMNLQSSANTIEIYMRTIQETSINFFYEKGRCCCLTMNTICRSVYVLRKYQTHYPKSPATSAP